MWRTRRWCSYARISSQYKSSRQTQLLWYWLRGVLLFAVVAAFSVTRRVPRPISLVLVAGAAVPVGAFDALQWMSNTNSLGGVVFLPVAAIALAFSEAVIAAVSLWVSWRASGTARLVTVGLLALAFLWARFALLPPRA